MDAHEFLRKILINEEGWKRRAYPDPLTKGAPWTIGVGHTGPEVHQGLVWNDIQIMNALDQDIAEAVDDCARGCPWYCLMNEPRQAVLIAMFFQMGYVRTMKFKNTLEFIRNGEYAAAADGMLASLWARQTPLRAVRMANIMRTGKFYGY